AVLDHVGFERRAGHDGLADAGVVPGERIACVVEADLDLVQVHRARVGALDVVFARPEGLDRHAGRLGDVGRFGDEIGGRVAAPAEAAAEERRMDIDLFRLHAEDGGGSGLFQTRRLGTGPDVTAVLADLYGAVERLHR